MKKYEELSIEVMTLEVSDVITTSGFDGEEHDFPREV